MIKNILMVCMGNICRSPMAEGLLKNYVMQRELSVNVCSAGITAMLNQPAVNFAREVMQEKKAIDISMHRARQLELDLLLNADLVLVMDRAQQQQIEFVFPSVCGRVHRIGKWSGFDIADPHLRQKQVFEQTLVLIEQCINDWQFRLWK